MLRGSAKTPVSCWRMWIRSRIVIIAMKASKASMARPAAGKMPKDGMQPHEPVIRIETVSGDRGVMNNVLMLSSEVKRGAQ